MDRQSKKRLVPLILLTASIVFGLVTLERFIHSDAACGCSSACWVIYPEAEHRLAGFFIMAIAYSFALLSLSQWKGLSRWWSIPALLLFGVAFYGNGWMMFNKGPCGQSLNLTTWYTVQEKIADYAQPDGESLDLDSLNAGVYKGRLLGYSFKGNELWVFRIAEPPLKVRTSFLFWKMNANALNDKLSYGIQVHRNGAVENGKGHYEFIGGQGMTASDFIAEFASTQKELRALAGKRGKLVEQDRGTTLFVIEGDTSASPGY